MAYPPVIAPCRGLILTQEELKVQFPSYYDVMHQLRLDESRFRGGVRRFIKNLPREPTNSDFKYELKIPKPMALKLRSQDLYHIIISSAPSPNAFTFQLVQHAEELENMEIQMKVFYENPETNHSSPLYGIAAGLFEGSFYAMFSRRRRKWVRCMCTGDVPVVSMSTLANMALIDYGCTEVTSSTSVRPLIPSFASLPAQGYTAQLLYTPEGSTRMSKEVCQSFREMVNMKTFYCYLTQRKEVEKDRLFPHAVLILTENKEATQSIVGETGSVDTIRSLDKALFPIDFEMEV